MAQWHDVAAADDVWDGVPLGVDVAGACIALYRIGDGMHAAADLCPHQKDVRLSQGYLDGHTIECPMHQSCFDVRSGAVLGPPAREPIAVYPVKIEGGRVFVEL